MTNGLKQNREVILERFDGDHNSFAVCEGEHNLQVYYCDDSKDPYFIAYCTRCGYNLVDLPVRLIEEVFKK